MSSNAMKLKNVIITANGMYWTGAGFGKSEREAKRYSTYSKAQAAIKSVKSKCSDGANIKISYLPDPFDALL